MLRAAMHERRVLLLLDGLDEAGVLRGRIEKHVAEVLAPKGFVVLCTSRPAGLDEACFAGFHRLTLAPLSDAQQEAFLATRLGDARASALKSYLRDKVPLDAAGEAGTKRRVTANPLMLSMVCSIAQLRVGIESMSTVPTSYMLGPEVHASVTCVGFTNDPLSLICRKATRLVSPWHATRLSCLGRSRQFWKSCVAHGATSCLAISAGERLRSTNQRSFLTPRTLTTTGSSTKRGKWSNSQSLPSRGIAFSSFVPVSASLPRNRKPGRSTYMEIS